MIDEIKTIVKSISILLNDKMGKSEFDKINNDFKSEMVSTLNNAVAEKMDKNDPVGTGSFSLNREADTVIGINSHAEGNSTEASGHHSHAEGNHTTASGINAHAEGNVTTASGPASHAEGERATASGTNSHAEGCETTASGSWSHAEGYNTTASQNYSHAEGYHTTASGYYSHAEGRHTIAHGADSHVQGKFNIKDTTMHTYAHIVGNGESSTKRSNAHTLDWDGNAWYQGDIYVGGTGQDDEAAEKLAKVSDVEEMIANAITAALNTEV